MMFVRGLNIHSPGSSMMFEGSMALFQRTCFEAMETSLSMLSYAEKPFCGRWSIERTKKAAKDSDIAVILLWFLAFPTRHFYSQVGAANREQASIVKERMTHLLHHNPWLNEYVDLVQWNGRS